MTQPETDIPRSLTMTHSISRVGPQLLAVLALLAGNAGLAVQPTIQALSRERSIELSWPGADFGFRVEVSSPNTETPVWRPVPKAPTRSGTAYRMTLPLDGEAGFFRLFGGPGAVGEPDYPGDYRDTNGDGIDGDFARAIFLAPPPFGNDLNPGTATAPVASLEQAVELAESIPLRQSVYMAKGTYIVESPLQMPPRVSLFGWFDGTTNWTYSADNLTRIVGPSTVLVFGEYPGDPSDHAVRVAGLEILAADATAPGASSYTVRVRNRSSQVLFDRCRIVAGRGATGTSGASGQDGAQGQHGGDGANAIAAGTGGRSGAASGARTGGAGGTGGLGTPGNRGTAGEGLAIETPTPPGSGGGSRTGCRRGDNGAPGEAGADGTNGRNAARNPILWGNLEPEGYVPVSGMDGTAGTSGAGGGGGGGGGSNSSGTVVGCPPQQAAGGGGGGSGGLPGTVGRGGQAGGSSIAVYSHVSRVILIDCILEAQDGAAGGPGGNGGIGGPGGAGGNPGSAFGYGAAGGPGGKGGTGGASGAGSGGPGGHSFCLLFDRQASSSDDYTQGTTFIVGRAGPGGPGGTNAVLGTAQSGRPGLASPIATRPQ